MHGLKMDAPYPSFDGNIATTTREHARGTGSRRVGGRLGDRGLGPPGIIDLRGCVSASSRKSIPPARSDSSRRTERSVAILTSGAMVTRYCVLLSRLACPSCLLDGLKLDALPPTVVCYEASFTLAACGPFCP